MSVQVLDSCPGCGKCALHGVCPTGAITIDNGKAVIGQGCIDCGICIPSCPIGLIRPASPAEITNHEWEEAAEEIGEEDQNGETSSGA
ncbi:4Fe-4S dicluster domain-containing protein [Alicyclobacillus fastidiosus]|uniref:4Fe-4S dicluster domain-containing protein n=1 Tax=Alicyclobacillus fastidiosus TaxID=392011 RepID=UPI0034D608C3